MTKRALSKRVCKGPCSEWAGSLRSDGYGTKWSNGRMEYAHRIAYIERHGGIPEGLQIDHLCRNRRCVNPDHLEAVTQRENILRGESACAMHARKTHCINDHEFTPENTYRRPDNGGRVCRTCVRERKRQAARV